MGRILSIVVVIWLLIGVLAAFQRDYFSGARTNCAEASNIALTVIAGPLNYVGLNPKVKCKDVEVPEPSR
jgi:hypothetical protein